MNNDQSRNEYLQRIHKVQDYIEENLTGALVLSELADIAGFSKYHFHRIFSAITNETLLQYVNRIKMERAAFLLLHHPDTNMTDIAYRFGFTDSAVFSRSFKHYYGVSPTEYKNQNSKNCKDPPARSQYNKSALNQNIGSGTMDTKARNVEIISVDMQVIYIRYTGTYQGLAAAMPGMMERLYGFAMSNNLLEPGKTKILSAYHDNPELTDETQLRTSLCMTIQNGVTVAESSGIGSMKITGKYAVGHFELMQNEYAAAWKYMFGEWLPSSGQKPRDTFPFEAYESDPATSPGGKQLIDIYLPVEPLGKI